jgi:hypothetical protein
MRQTPPIRLAHPLQRINAYQRVSPNNLGAGQGFTWKLLAGF